MIVVIVMCTIIDFMKFKVKDFLKLFLNFLIFLSYRKN